MMVLTSCHVRLASLLLAHVHQGTELVFSCSIITTQYVKFVPELLKIENFNFVVLR